VAQPVHLQAALTQDASNRSKACTACRARNPIRGLAHHTAGCGSRVGGDFISMFTRLQPVLGNMRAAGCVVSVSALSRHRPHFTLGQWRASVKAAGIFSSGCLPLRGRRGAGEAHVAAWPGRSHNCGCAPTDLKADAASARGALSYMAALPTVSARPPGPGGGVFRATAAHRGCARTVCGVELLICVSPAVARRGNLCAAHNYLHFAGGRSGRRLSRMRASGCRTGGRGYRPVSLCVCDSLHGRCQAWPAQPGCQGV